MQLRPAPASLGEWRGRQTMRPAVVGIYGFGRASSDCFRARTRRGLDVPNPVRRDALARQAGPPPPGARGL